MNANVLLLTLVLAQPAPVPRPPEVPVIEEFYRSYWDAYELSKKSDKAIVLYVGTKPYAHDWGITAYERTFTRHNGIVETKAILVTSAKTGRGHWLYPSMTEQQKQAEVDAFFAEAEVRRAPQAQPVNFPVRAAPARSVPRQSANC